MNELQKNQNDRKILGPNGTEQKYSQDTYFNYKLQFEGKPETPNKDPLTLLHILTISLVMKITRQILPST